MRGALLVLALGVIPAGVRAQGWVMPRPCGVPMLDDRVRPAMPIQTCDASVVRVRSDVRAELVGNGASRVVRYEVEERFVNRGGRLGEADYMFPLPKGAAFQDLKLSINGELVSGETMNATDARRIYEEIVRRQRDPALVEWMGYGLLRARIFPINPGEEKRVVVRFQMVAEREGDAVRVDYFRGARNVPGLTRERPMPEQGSSSFTFIYPRTPELGTAYSPTHGVDVADNGSERRVDVRGDASDLTLLIPLRQRNEASISMLANAPGGEDGFALITLSPPASMSRGEATPRDVTLVLDVSGSMSGVKMDQARAAGRQMLHTLRPADRFRLIDFSSDVHTFRDEFSSASQENIRAAERYLDALEAQGSTNISGALREALGANRGPEASERMPVVLFITDGEPTVGERDPSRIADAASHDRGAARVFTFGVGTDVNVTLLEQLALEGRGTAQFVRPEESVERAVGLVAGRIVDPVLTDVRVRTDGDVRLAKVLPEQPVDLFAGQDLVLLARYAGHGDTRVIFEGKHQGQTVRWTSTVDFPDRERDNPFVARLWATQRIGWLAAEKRKNGGSSEIDDEIRGLGERFGIPTEFTSYLVQENRAVAGVGGALRRDLPTGLSPAAAPMRDQAFEQAKAASAQRAALSMMVLDSIARPESRGRSDANTKRAGSHTFLRQDSTWTDLRPAAKDARTIRIKAFSKAYFDLIDAVPELRAIFAVGDRVTAQGRAVTVVVSDSGAEQLSAAEVRAVGSAW
ncbi:MAG TPA: VIT domain-containing protein [Gemmatimonadaceae bacterium]